MKSQLKNSLYALLVAAGAIAAVTASAFAAPADPADLRGIYKMDIQIGDRAFTDIVEISEGRAAYGSQLKGTLTVPGVFTVPLTGSIEFIGWTNPFLLRFEILAKENGREFVVRYEARLTHPLTRFKGAATLEDGSTLGHFQAVKLYEHP